MIKSLSSECFGGKNCQNRRQLDQIKSKFKKIDQSMIKFHQTIKKAIFQTFYFLGPTGSGKSSLINYLLNFMGFGGYKCSTVTKVCQLYPKDKEKSALIGNNQGTSQTATPQIFCSKDNQHQICYVDTPGFMSTKGIAQQMTDTYANSLIFKKSTHIKLGIILDFQTFRSNRGQVFMDILRKIQSLFQQNYSSVIKSTCLILTKVQTDVIIDKQIISLFKQIIQQKLRKNKNNHINHLLEPLTELGNQRLFIFPFASKLKQEMINQLKNKMLNVNSVVLSTDATFQLNDKAKNLIQQLKRQNLQIVSQQFVKLIQKLLERYQNLNEQISIYVQKIKQIETIKGQLNNIKMEFALDIQKISEFNSKWDANYPFDSLKGALEYLKICQQLNIKINPIELKFYDTIQFKLEQIKSNLLTKKNILETKQLQKQRDQQKSKKQEQEKKRVQAERQKKQQQARRIEAQRLREESEKNKIAEQNRRRALQQQLQNERRRNDEQKDKKGLGMAIGATVGLGIGGPIGAAIGGFLGNLF